MIGSSRKPHWLDILIFLLLFSGPPTMRDRDIYASLASQVDLAILVNAAVWGIGALWVLREFNRYALIRQVLPRPGRTQVLALIFVGVLSLSILVSPAPLLSAYRVGQVAISALFAYFWLDKYGAETTLRWLIYGLLILNVLMALSAIFEPGWVYSEYRLRGEWLGDSGAITSMAIIGLLGFPVILKNRALYLILLALCSVVLALTFTRAAYAVVAVFALISLLRFPESAPLRRTVVIVVFVAVPLVLMSGLVAKVVPVVFRDADNIPSLGGRIPLWDYTLRVTLSESPWVGYGFYANRNITTAFNPALGTSHNAFVEILSGGGILSFAAFLLLLLPRLAQAAALFIQHGRTPLVFTVVCLLGAAIAHGMVTEEMIIASPISLIFWMTLYMIPMLARFYGFAPDQPRLIYENSAG